MIVLYRLILSAVLTGVTATILGLVSQDGGQNPVVLAIIFVAITIGAFVSPAINSTSNTETKPNKTSTKAGKREQGVVKWFNVSKGYGFVTRASGEEIFVHFRSIRGKGRKVLREGQKIEFSVTQGDKGPQADDIEPLAK